MMDLLLFLLFVGVAYWINHQVRTTITKDILVTAEDIPPTTISTTTDKDIFVAEDTLTFSTPYPLVQPAPSSPTTPISQSLPDTLQVTRNITTPTVSLRKHADWKRAIVYHALISPPRAVDPYQFPE